MRWSALLSVGSCLLLSALSTVAAEMVAAERAVAMEAAARAAAREEVLAAARAVVPKPPSQAEIAELAEEIAKFVGC